MRKSPPKLALRKQTLRAISTPDLARAVGGQGDDVIPAVGSSDGKACPVAAAALLA